MKWSEDFTPLSAIAAGAATIGERLFEAAIIIVPILFEIAAVAFFVIAAGLWSAWSAGLL